MEIIIPHATHTQIYVVANTIYETVFTLFSGIYVLLSHTDN